LVLFRFKQQRGLHSRVNNDWRSVGKSALALGRILGLTVFVSLVVAVLSYCLGAPYLTIKWACLLSGARVLQISCFPYIFPSLLLPQTASSIEYPFPVPTTLLSLATSRQSTLLVTYLNKYIKNLEHWLRDWRIVFNLWTNISVLFARLRDDLKKKPRPLQPFLEGDKWVDTADTRTFGQQIRSEGR
jgi:hypothetical protein